MNVASHLPINTSELQLTYEEFASDLPLGRTITFASAEENEETLRGLGVNQEVRQLGRGPFRCDMAVRSTEEADLFVDRFSKAVSITLASPADGVGLLFPRSADGPFVASGVSVTNDALAVVPDGSELDIVAPDLCGSEALGITKSRFTELTEVLCPSAKLVGPTKTALFRGDTIRMRALSRAVVDLVHRPESDPIGEEVSNLLAEIIAWLAECSPNYGPESFTVNGARRRVAKLAQEFIEEHYRKTVRIDDICRVTGVGVRTLQRCFKEYFHLTITDYLNTVRLAAAHRALMAAQPSEDSVISVAMRTGNMHTGRFSLRFCERFGESPSETLAMRVRR